MADAQVSGACGSNTMWVRLPSPAPSESNPNRWVALFLSLQNLPDCQV